MKPPKISVIVPIYNVEKYLRSCLDSLVNQTLQDIEIVCIDDGSTDTSVSIVNEFIKQDSRIKLLKNDKNYGQSFSRNIGLTNSVAPYIMFCDSDDFYAPNMCEEMYNNITKSNADIGICGINIIYEPGTNSRKSDREYYRIKYTGIQPVTCKLINKCDVSPCNKIFKRSIIDAHNLSFPVELKFEDAYWFFCYMLWAEHAVFVNKKLYNYVRHDASTMSQTFKKNSSLRTDHLKIAIKIFDYLKTHNKYDSLKDWYWKSIFTPMLSFAIEYNTPSNQHNLFTIAKKFLRVNYPPEKSFGFINRLIKFVTDDGFVEHKNKHLFGMISSTETFNEKRGRFCGIRIYKNIYCPDGIKHDIFKIKFTTPYTTKTQKNESIN